jgi:hypothetical protein
MATSALMMDPVSTQRPRATYEAPLVTDLGRLEDITKGAGMGKITEAQPNKT